MANSTFSAIMRPKLDEFATLKEIPFSLKKMPSQHPLSLDGFCDPFNETNYFSVCYCIVLPNVVCFRKFTFRLLKISIVEKKIDSQARAENQTKHPIKKKNQNAVHTVETRTHDYVDEKWYP